MADNASDILVDTLIAWNVDTIFGLPGDGINGLMEALRKKQDKLRFIQVRHEEAAAFMACGYARYTGRLGVCLATSGPGGIHLLNGLYDAKLDGQPVLAITGLQFHDLLKTHAQQDVELDKLFMDVCVYNARIMGPAHVENVVDLACRSALAQRGVAHITIPVDTQEEKVAHDYRSKRNVAHHASHWMAYGAMAPAEDQLQAAADVLNNGERIAIIAGRGALGARAELIATAERLKAPIIKPLLGKGAVPDAHPLTTGGIGLLGTKPSQDALEDCDTLLIVGSSFPYVEYYPRPGRAKCVQIEIDPKRVSLRHPVDAALIGDSAGALRVLLPRLRENPNGRFLERAQKGMAAWRELMRERGTRADSPMKPEVVAYELNKLIADNTILATDSGTVTTWIARQVDMRGDMMFACSGNLATMACGLPYANAAALAFPDRPVICFVGDGALTMLICELATAVKYGLNVKIVVIKNNTFGQIKWEQLVFLGNPEYGCELQPIDFAAIARGFGLRAYSVEDPGRCGATLSEALATPGPVLVEALVDPFEPPLPPRTTVEQATNFAKSLAKGTPNAGKIALTVASDKVREMV